MARIIWSPRAADDLEEICEFIARDSRQYASIVAQRILDAIERVAAMPESGSIVPEHNRRDLRECFVHHYRIIYRLRGNAIEIVVVRHSARQLPHDIIEN
jgi:addiction module RelE/StbE family toxin